MINEEKLAFETELPQDIRKPLSELALKALRKRLKPILDLINTIADYENVQPKTIAAYTLQIIANEDQDRNTADSMKELVATGSFGCAFKHLPIDKSVFLLDFLEIGKRKYTNLRRLCKPEKIIFPAYNKLAEYRSIMIKTLRLLM